MSCPSGIYVVNTTSTSIAANDTIPINTIVRRYGSAVQAVSNGVMIRQPGYYKVDVFATVIPTTAGDVTLSLKRDNAVVNGAYIMGAAAANLDPIPLSFSVMVRQGCCSEPAVLTLSANAAGSVNNAGMVVTKL